ncbi:MAG: hypothetical protein ACH350_08935 [Parachlamydiaceae bacterium]
MKLANRKRVEELEKACNFEKGKPSYALVIYSAEMADKISELEVDADFVVALPDNGRGDLGKEIPKGGYKVFFD